MYGGHLFGLEDFKQRYKMHNGVFREEDLKNQFRNDDEDKSQVSMCDHPDNVPCHSACPEKKAQELIDIEDLEKQKADDFLVDEDPGRCPTCKPDHECYFCDQIHEIHFQLAVCRNEITYLTTTVRQLNVAEEQKEREKTEMVKNWHALQNQFDVQSDVVQQLTEKVTTLQASIDAWVAPSLAVSQNQPWGPDWL